MTRAMNFRELRSGEIGRAGARIARVMIASFSQGSAVKRGPSNQAIEKARFAEDVGPRRHLEFVAADLEFVALGLEFVAVDLEKRPAGAGRFPGNIRRGPPN